MRIHHILHVVSTSAPGDYTSVSSDLTFDADTSTQTIEISITSDIELEMSESFSVSLSQMPVDASVILNPASATVNVEDDDSKLMNDFSQAVCATSSQFLLLYSCYNRIHHHNL